MKTINRQDIAKANIANASDVLVFVDMRCKLKQSVKSDTATDKILELFEAEEGVAEVTSYTLPEPVQSVKKWIENTRTTLATRARHNGQGGKYNYNGRIGAQVPLERQDSYLEEVDEFIELARKRLLDAATGGRVDDRQEGYKDVLSNMRGRKGKFSNDVPMPVNYQDFLDQFSVYKRVISFSSTPQFKAMSAAVQQAIKDTEDLDSCDAYNGLLHSMQTSLSKAILKLKKLSELNPDDGKWPALRATTLNSILFVPYENCLPMVPRVDTANTLFNVCWAVLGSTPEEMRQHFTLTKQIKDTPEAWAAVVKKNPRLGVVNKGIQGRWNELFNDSFKELPLNRHEAGDKELPNQIKIIGGKDKALFTKLIELHSIVKSIPRIDTGR